MLTRYLYYYNGFRTGKLGLQGRRSIPVAAWFALWLAIFGLAG